MSRDELDKYFAAWSSHQMRRVTTDLIAHSRKRHTQHQLILDRLDSDKSGYVSPDEIREVCRRRRRRRPCVTLSCVALRSINR